MYTRICFRMFPGPAIWHWITKQCALSWSLFLTQLLFTVKTCVPLLRS